MRARSRSLLSSRRAAVQAVAVLLGLACAMHSAPAWGAVYYVNSCATSSSVNAAPVFSATTSGIGFTTGEDCAALVAGLQADVIGGASNGAAANWSAETPSTALGIVGVQAS